MSKNDNTNEQENFNSEVKMIARIEVSAQLANEVLSKIDAPAPDASDLDEIILLVKKPVSGRHLQLT